MRESFVRWLHRVCLEDSERDRLYSPVYRIGPLIESTIGINGEFSIERITAALELKYVDDDIDEYIEALVHAEAAWRVDRLEADEAEVLPAEIVLIECSHVSLKGISCGNMPVPGGSRCEVHGGAVLDPAVRRSVLLVSYAKMLEAGDIAVEALIDVAENSKNALARVHASREILDRVGLVHQDGAHMGEDSNGLADEPQTELLEEFRRGLGAARDRLRIVAAPATEEPGIEDAEVVAPAERSEPTGGEL